MSVAQSTKICPHCGDLFDTDAHYRARKFCSMKCYHAKRTARPFWPRVAIGGENECWLWAGRTLNGGYGCIGSKNNHAEYLAHRMAWFLTYGKIPDKMHVLHKCDAPGCCNPDHLFLGTHSDNMKDKVAKNRQYCPPSEVCRSTKLTIEQVRRVRILRADGMKLNEIAVRFGITCTSVCDIAKRHTWKHVT